MIRWSINCLVSVAKPIENQFTTEKIYVGYYDSTFGNQSD